MGREVKRVALDFDWPLNKTWKGYIDNPYVDKGCTNPQCSGGQSALGWYIQSLCYALFQAASNQHHGHKMHPWTKEIVPCAGETAFPGGKHPEGLDEFVAGLCDAKVEGFFPRNMFDSAAGDQYILMQKLFEKAGLKDIYNCKVCDGSGMQPEFLKRFEAWEDTEPPAGEGWQMWETVSEGSPISPVCKTPEELARYMADNPWGAMRDGNYDQWFAMIKAGWAPSAIVVDGKFMTGVEAVSEMAKEAEHGQEKE